MTLPSPRQRTKQNLRNNRNKIKSIQECLALMVTEGYTQYDDISKALYLESELLDKIFEVNEWLYQRI